MRTVSNGAGKIKNMFGAGVLPGCAADPPKQKPADAASRIGR
jgi:hypothetical protein